MTETYGEWLRRIRTERGLTQEELGRRIDVARPYVNNIERGRVAFPNLELRLKIAAELGEDYDARPARAINEAQPPYDADVDEMVRIMSRWPRKHRRWLLDLMESTDGLIDVDDNDVDGAA